MYFKIDKSSETGKKIVAVHEEIKRCREAAGKLAKKFTKDKRWLERDFDCFGGISAIYNKEEGAMDMKGWKKIDGDYYSPRLNSNKGREIKQAFDDLPVIPHRKLNACFGEAYDKGFILAKDGNYWRSIIPVLYNNASQYIVIDLEERFITEAFPSDCIEITKTEFNNL